MLRTWSREVEIELEKHLDESEHCWGDPFYMKTPCNVTILDECVGANSKYMYLIEIVGSVECLDFNECVKYSIRLISWIVLSSSKRTQSSRRGLGKLA